MHRWHGTPAHPLYSSCVQCDCRRGQQRCIALRRYILHTLQVLCAVGTWVLLTYFASVAFSLALPVVLAQVLTVAVAVTLAIVCYNLSTLIHWFYWASWKLLGCVCTHQSAIAITIGSVRSLWSSRSNA